jgi:hypothetical protein
MDRTAAGNSSSFQISRFAFQRSCSFERTIQYCTVYWECKQSLFNSRFGGGIGVNGFEGVGNSVALTGAYGGAQFHCLARPDQ